MEYQILAEVFMPLLAAVVILYLFRRLRLPPVLDYLVVGVAEDPPARRRRKLPGHALGSGGSGSAGIHENVFSMQTGAQTRS